VGAVWPPRPDSVMSRTDSLYCEPFSKAAGPTWASARLTVAPSRIVGVPSGVRRQLRPHRSSSPDARAGAGWRGPREGRRRFRRLSRVRPYPVAATQSSRSSALSRESDRTKRENSEGDLDRTPALVSLSVSNRTDKRRRRMIYSPLLKGCSLVACVDGGARCWSRLERQG
jgi:hypothetical protein